MAVAVSQEEPHASALGWTECAPLLFCEPTLPSEGPSEVCRITPFPLLGLDADTDPVSIET